MAACVRRVCQWEFNIFISYFVLFVFSDALHFFASLSLLLSLFPLSLQIFDFSLKHTVLSNAAHDFLFHATIMKMFKCNQQQLKHAPLPPDRARPQQTLHYQNAVDRMRCTVEQLANTEFMRIKQNRQTTNNSRKISRQNKSAYVERE